MASGLFRVFAKAVKAARARGPIALFGAILILAAPARPDSSSVQQRAVIKIADGIYVIRHKDAPNGFPQGNTTVIIGDRDVFVVDSCYLPSSAREDIAEIRTWTNKPVRYLLNTHWHADHSRGNVAYAEAFPAISIISQTVTRELIKGFYADHPENAAALVHRDVVVYKRFLDNGKTDDGTPLGEDDKNQIRAILSGADAVAAEFTNLVPRLPDVTFEEELDLNLGNREVQIKFLGRGNTAGDAIAFLPKDGIIVAGDLVVHPGPYMGSGFPAEWIQTLQKMIEMNPRVIVPGHGEVLHDAAYLRHLNEMATAVVAQVREKYYQLTNRASLDDVRKAMDLAGLRNRFGEYFKDDAQNGEPFLDLDGLVKVTYEETQPR